MNDWNEQAALDAEYLRSIPWNERSPAVLRWIRTRVELLLNDPERLAALGDWDPMNPGATKALQEGGVQDGAEATPQV